MFSLTDKQQSKQDKKWKSTHNSSHNIDPRIVDVVRLLARRCAEEDYKHHLKSTTSLSQKSDTEL